MSKLLSHHFLAASAPLRPVHIFLLCFILLVAPIIAFGQMSIASVGVPVVQNFDVPGTSQCTANLPWANDATIPFCYSDRPTYNYSNGCANIGGLHIAGANGETALGGRGSNSTQQVRWGVRFKNNTGVTLSGLHISMRCEQWGQAQSDLANNVVQFGYRTSSSPITDVLSGTYLTDPTWNLVSFTAPTGCSGGNTAIDGNAPANSAMHDGCLNVTLAPGDEIMLRWFDTNDACNDHMLCVDDLIVTGVQAPTLTADGPTTFCTGDSVTLTVDGASEVQWSTGASGASITVTESGTYTATCPTACGEEVLTRTVTVNIAPVAAIATNGALQLCPGSTLQLTASGGPAFLWNTGETTPVLDVTTAGTYSVQVTDACGTDEAEVTVTTLALPVAAIDPTGEISFCEGSSATLTASGGDTYAWSTGAAFPSITINEEGTWTVTVTNICGSDEATVESTFAPLPSVQLAASATVLCAGDAITLTASGGDTYVWSTGATGASLVVNAPGNYSVTASNSCGDATDSRLITASNVNAAFIASTTSGAAPLEVIFDNTSTPVGPSAWDLGNGSSSDASPTATYTEPGVYEVTLTATDPLTGCTDTAMARITVVSGVSWITVPNIFTPNGDGRNDVFQVMQDGIIDFNMVLSNRWGNEVMHLDHVEQTWNGKANGDAVPDGVYFYVIHAQGSDGRAQDLTGQVTLVR